MDGFGGPEVLRVGPTDDPRAESGRVIVKAEATSVNRADISQREGRYPPPKGESEILGLEVAGLIEELGPDVAGFGVGDRVMALVAGGGYAERVSVHASHLIPVPESMSFEEAACVCEAYVTAYLNLFMLAGLDDRYTVLLHGGGGGVNTAAIQLCRTLAPDVRVIVTCSPRKIQRVRDLGADLVVDYTADDFATATRDFTNGRGADVVLDHIGASYLESNLRALGSGGRLVIIGVMGGAKAELNLARLMVKRQWILGSVLRSRPVDDKAAIIAEFSRIVMPHFAARRIAPLIHAIYPLEEVATAHSVMEASGHFGKLVLTT